MSAKKVSIIIPVYNAAASLENCLKSVLQQTYKNIEIILVDDGSTDNSRKICASYAKKYNNIKLIGQPNSGPSAARNNGIINSTGDFIQFVDSDDTIEKNMTETLVNALEENTQLVICGFKRIHIRSGETEKLSNKTNAVCNIDEFLNAFGFYYEDWLINSVWNKMYISEIIKNNDIKFNINISMGEDLIFNLDYLRKCQKIVILQDILYNYIAYSSGSLTSSYLQNEFKVQKYLYTHVKNFLIERSHYHKTKKRSNQLVFFNSIIRCLENINGYCQEKDEKLRQMSVIFENKEVRELSANIVIYKFSLRKISYFILLKLRSPCLVSTFFNVKNKIKTKKQKIKSSLY